MIYPNMAYVKSICHEMIIPSMGPIEDADSKKLELDHSEALSLDKWKETVMLL